MNGFRFPGPNKGLSMGQMSDTTGEVNQPLPTAPLAVPSAPPMLAPASVNPNLIFASTAPRYFAAGLSVTPLEPMSKKAQLKEWTRFHDHLPPPEMQAEWVQHYGNGNIGLLLGQQSNLVMIDIDSVDDDLVKIIIGALPPSPWCKIGKKGVTLAYKFNGTKTFRIKNSVGGMLVEHLSSGTQTVIPPSIHPDTGRAYVESGDLIAMMDQLVQLPLDIEERLRTVLVNAGQKLSMHSYTKLGDKISVGSRDVKLTADAGLYANLVLRGERTLAQAANELRAIVRNFVEDVAGDPVNPEKHVTNMINFINKDVVNKKKRLPKGWDEGLTDEEKQAFSLNFGEDNIERNHDELIAYLKHEFETNPVEGSGRTVAIDKVLDEIRSSKTLSDIDQERVLSYIASTSGLGIKITTLRKTLRDRQSKELKGLNHSEIASTLQEEYNKISPVKFHNGTFWQWGGSHWLQMENALVLAKIIKDYGDLPAAKRHSDHRGIFGTLAALTGDSLQKNKMFGVNFANGFLRRDMVLEPHNPDYGMTYTLPYRYMPDEAHRCPMWLEFLERAWGQDEDYHEKVEALRDVMCITMFGLGPSMQRAVLLYGIPHSGKSTVMDVMIGLMPPEAQSVISPSAWADKFSPVQMHNKLLNVCGELSHKHVIDGAKFKMITAGDPIEVQFKGRDSFIMRPTATHWFSSNHLPKSDDDTGAFIRRWLVLTFNSKFPEDKKKDRYAEVMLAAEREAICAWVMEAASKFKESSIPTFPSSHKRVAHEMFNLHNSVRMFLFDSGIVRSQKKSELDESQLHDRYWSYCVQTGLGKPLSQKMFRVKARDFETDLGFKIVMRKDERTGVEEAIFTGLEFIK